MFFYFYARNYNSIESNYEQISQTTAPNKSIIYILIFFLAFIVLGLFHITFKENRISFFFILLTIMLFILTFVFTIILYSEIRSIKNLPYISENDSIELQETDKTEIEKEIEKIQSKQEDIIQENLKKQTENSLSLALKVELKNKINKLSKILQLPENLPLEEKITKILIHWNKIGEKIRSLNHKPEDNIYSQQFLAQYLAEYTQKLKFIQTHRILLHISEKILQETLIFLNFLIEKHFSLPGPIFLDDISNFLHTSLETHRKEKEHVNNFYHLLNLQKNHNFTETFHSLRAILGEQTLEYYVENQKKTTEKDRNSLNNIFLGKKSSEIEQILHSLKIFQNYLNRRNMSYENFGTWLENNEIYENKIKFLENCFQDTLENLSLHFEVLQSYKLSSENNKILELDISYLEQFLNIFLEIGGNNPVENLNNLLENTNFLNLEPYLLKLEIVNSLELFQDKIQKIQNILKHNNIENIGNYLREIEEFQTMKKNIDSKEILEKLNNLRNFHGFIKTLQNYHGDRIIIDSIEKFMPLYDFMNMLLRLSTNHNLEFSGNFQNLSLTIQNFSAINYFINLENDFSISSLADILRKKNIQNYSDIKEQKKKIKMLLEKKIDYKVLRENTQFIQNLENIFLKHNRNSIDFTPTLKSSKKYNKNEKLLNIIYAIDPNFQNLELLEQFLENNRIKILEKLNYIDQISEKISLNSIIELKNLLKNNTNYNLEIIEKNIQILRENHINLEQEICNQDKYNKILLEICTLIKNFNHIYGKKIIQNIANISFFLQLFLRESNETIECYNSITSFDFSIISKNYNFYRNLLEKRTIKEIGIILQKFPEISLAKIKKEVEDILQFFQKIYNSIKNAAFFPEKNISAILSMHSVLKNKNISILDITKKNKNISEQISIEFLHNLNLLTRKKAKKISLSNILETIVASCAQNNINFLSSIRLNPNSEYLPDLFIILLSWISFEEIN